MIQKESRNEEQRDINMKKKKANNKVADLYEITSILAIMNQTKGRNYQKRKKKSNNIPLFSYMLYRR